MTALLPVRRLERRRTEPSSTTIDLEVLAPTRDGAVLTGSAALPLAVNDQLAFRCGNQHGTVTVEQAYCSADETRMYYRVRDTAAADGIHLFAPYVSGSRWLVDVPDASESVGRSA